MSRRAWTAHDRLLLEAVTATCARCRAKQRWASLQGALSVALPRLEHLLSADRQPDAQHCTAPFRAFWELCLQSAPSAEALLQTQLHLLGLLGSGASTDPAAGLQVLLVGSKLHLLAALLRAGCAALSTQPAVWRDSNLLASCAAADEPQPALLGLATTALCDASPQAGTERLQLAASLLQQAGELQASPG